jgi:hypothetical protein
VEIERLVSKLFGPPEQMYARTPVPCHRDRWIIVDRARLKIYLDHFVGQGWCRAPEYYPKQSISVGLAEFVEGNPLALDASHGQLVWMLLISRSRRRHQKIISEVNSKTEDRTVERLL